MPHVTQTHEPSLPSYRLIMILMALVVAFAFQGSRGLYETTEGRYAEAGREMFETGNYLEPTLNYQPHWTKPPMTYWAIAAGIKLLGRNEWGARLYLAVAFILTVLVVYGLGQTLWGERVGLIAGFVYLSSPFPVIGANSVSTDAILTLWEIAAVLCYLKAVKAIKAAPCTQWRWIVLMWIVWGLAFLTKGPPALLPLIPIILWHQWRTDKPRLFDPLGIALFLTIGLSWYIAVCLRHTGLVRYFLGREVVGRVFSEEDRNPQLYKAFLYYIPALTAGAGAWLYYGVQLRYLLWRRVLLLLKIARFYASRVFLSRERRYAPVDVLAETSNASIATFLVMWMSIPLLVFFVVKSRLFFYVLPLYAPVALAMARWISLKEKPGARIGRTVAIAAAMAAILIAAKGAGLFYPSSKDMKAAYQLCRKVEKEKPVFVVVNEERYFGLQFYLDGALKRVSISHKHTPAPGEDSFWDGTLQASLEAIRKDAGRRPYAYLVVEKRADGLVEQLKRAGLPFEQYKGKFWSLCFVRGKSGETPARPGRPEAR